MSLLWKSFAGLLVVFLFSNAVAFSQEISIQTMHAGETVITHNLFLEGEKEIELTVFDEAEEVSVISNGQNLFFEMTGGQLQIENPDGFETILVQYLSNSVTSKLQEQWFIELNAISGTVSRLEIVLPPDSKITGFEPVASISFKEPNLVVSWSNENLNGFARVEYIQTGNGNADNGILTLIALITIIAVLIIVLFWQFKLKAKKETEMEIQKTVSLVPSTTENAFSPGKEDICRTLSEKEKKLLEFVVGADGCTQKQLHQKSGYSKATLSRTLKSLEQKEILRLVQDGYSNRVFLSDWFKNK